MTEPTGVGLADHAQDEYRESLSLLDDLGALRARREAETTTDLPLPGFNGRLWATFRLPKTAKATRVQALIAAGDDSLLGAAMEIIAESTAGIYTADKDAESPIMSNGLIRSCFQHLPGGSDMMPITFDARLDNIVQLCPPLAGNRQHTPATRVRTLFARDALVIACAMMVCGWALGTGDGPGALDSLSEQFVGESKGGPM